MAPGLRSEGRFFYFFEGLFMIPWRLEQIMTSCECHFSAFQGPHWLTEKISLWHFTDVSPATFESRPLAWHDTWHAGPRQSGTPELASSGERRSTARRGGQLTPRMLDLRNTSSRNPINLKYIQKMVKGTWMFRSFAVRPRTESSAAALVLIVCLQPH